MHWKVFERAISGGKNHVKFNYTDSESVLTRSASPEQLQSVSCSPDLKMFDPPSSLDYFIPVTL